MIPTWRPSEIIINANVREDPITKHILSQCPGVPFMCVPNSKPNTIKAASEVLSRETEDILHGITLGKTVLHIAEASSNVLDKFVMPDPRMMCPEFDKLVLASNGCYYNCDWCFLKGTYRENQNYITVRVQYDKIKNMLAKHLSRATAPVIFDTGEMADSLSMEHLTKAAQEFIPWFGEQPNGYMYMLTKSDNIEPILKLKHNKHTILAWSLNAPPVSHLFELGAPDLSARLKAAKKAQAAGYPVRVRLDPIVPIVHWQHHYGGTIKRIFEELQPERITLGTLRFEENLWKMRNTIIRHNLLKEMMNDMVPMLPKIQLPVGKHSVGKYSIPETERVKLFAFAIQEIRKYSDCDIALCKETKDVWDAVGLDLKECKCACLYRSADMTNRPDKEVITMAKETKATKKASKQSTPKPEETKAAPSPAKVLPDVEYEPRNLYHLDIDLLAPDPDQPRKSIDEAELKELKSSIEQHGVLQPILFRKNDKGELIIVSGERRYQASRLAKMKEIPAILAPGPAAEIALVENLLRVDLTAIEEAEALQRLKVEAKYSNKQLANVIGKAESTISEILKLNQLPDKLRNKYRTDKGLSKRRLLEVAKATTPEEMTKQFKKLLKEASRDELRQERAPRHRELDAVFKTMIGGLKTKLSEVNFDDIDEEKRTAIQTDLNDLVDLIDKKLGNV